MASGGSKRPPYNTELSTDSVPWSSNLDSIDVSVDAVPGRRYPGGVRPPPPRKTNSNPPEKKKDETEKQLSMKAHTSEVLEQVTKKIEDLSTSCESFDSSYSSNCDSSPTDSLPSLDLAEEIEKYRDDMPPYMKAPFIDVLVLYAERDREEVVKFKTHLETEIILPNNQKVVALLYDCPDFQGLSGSKLQHLDLAVERSTYVFVYLTKSFVEDNWCEISSESCLMKAIYDEEKRWCVVPVYTERRHQCKFKIPMGLNSLKGINYYNNDKFYRDGVARLIGDKVNVKFRMQEELKVRQKEWIEKFKRDQEKQRQLQLWTQRQEEEKTRLYKERLREESERMMKESLLPSFSGSDLYSMHHSSSTSSLKEIQEQDPHVADYFHQLRLYALNQRSARQMHPEQDAYQHRYPSNLPPFSPHINTSAIYSHNQQAVQRSPSQNSAVSNDAANSHPVPLEILDKIKDLQPEDQLRYIRFYQETQSMQLQQQAVMNMPPPIQVHPSQMAYSSHGTPYSGQVIQKQQFASSGPVQGPQFVSPGPVQGSAPNTDIVTDPLMNAPSLNLSLIGQGQLEGHGSHVNQTVGPQEMGQTSQVPNIIFDQSMNSYHPESVPGTFSMGESNVTSENDVSFATDQGGESRGQSVDCPRSNDEVGNLPDSGLFNSDSQPGSLEEDSGTHSIPSSLSESPDKMNVKKTIRETDSMEGDRRKGKVTETKKEKHVHYTINIYQANAVQVGDSNIVQGLGESEPESDDSDDEEDFDQQGKDVHKSTAKKPVNTNTSQKQLEEVQTRCNNHEPSTVPDAPPSTTRTDLITNPFSSANFNRNISSPVKMSGGDKPIGFATPIVPYPQVQVNDLDDKDATELKRVVPTEQTARKVVNGAVNRTRQSNMNNSGSLSANDGTAQILRKSNNLDSRGGENASRVRPTVVCPPVYPNQFGSSNASNPQMLFFRQAGQRGLTRVAPGDDPLRKDSAAPHSNMQESQGFQPDIDYEHANNFDMCEDDYEGGEFTESVEHTDERSGTRKIFDSILNRFSNKVK